MLSLNEISTFYPESLNRFPRFLLREYLQYKILEIIYESRYATGLCFLGGTCLRIIHGNQRFSEDLDFDNIGLSDKDFDRLSDTIKKNLSLQGCHIEIKIVKKDAWHCLIRFPGMLYEQDLSNYIQEKILIQIDTEPQNIHYNPEKAILNRFDVFTTALSTPLSLLMAQKLYAVINRERNKGRDFYDLAFLMSKETKPDYDYLKKKLTISDPAALKSKLIEKFDKLDMNEMANDVSPFLFDPRHANKVLLFKKLVSHYTF